MNTCLSPESFRVDVDSKLSAALTQFRTKKTAAQTDVPPAVGGTCNSTSVYTQNGLGFIQAFNRKGESQGAVEDSGARV